jgi:hypothetical protein
MRRWTFLFAWLLIGAWIVVGSGSAQAEPIAWPFGEKWSFATATSPNGGTDSAVTFMGNAGTRYGSNDILAATVLSFNNFSQPVVLDPSTVHETIYIRDDKSGQSGSATFDFMLYGALSSKAAWLSLIPQGATTQTLHLGSYYYTISVDPFRTPADPGLVAGWLLFDVTVRHNPEPASLLLAGLGASLLGVARWRKRKAV